MKKSMIFAAAAASVFAATAFAHSGATGIVKERMDAMAAMADTIKMLAPMMREEKPYDASVVRDAGKLIGSHAGTSMTKMFPPDSGGAMSEAKPSVWQSWEEFSELAERLHTYSEGLSLAADNGISTMMGGASSTSMMGGGTMMGGNAMMGSATMMDGMMSREALAEMPVDAVFNMVSQTCSACHTKFRAEAK